MPARIAPLAALLVAGFAPRAAAEAPVRTDWTVDDGNPREIPPPPAAAAAPAPPPAGILDGFHFDLDGYYRARTYVIGNQLFPLASDPDRRLLDLRYVTQRLRLQPRIGYGEHLTLHLTVDALDDVVWGDNAGLASTALFAGDPSLTGTTGSETPMVTVRHAWVEAKLPIGALHVGRVPSEWGLGLLTDDGFGFDDEFGDNHYGTTYDRILFATKPISIVRAIMGLESIDTPLVLAVFWEKLVEDFLEEGHRRPSYDAGWLGNHEDDVDDWVVVLAWDQHDLDWFGPSDAIEAGFYFVYREQPLTSSQVYIYDAYAKVRLWDFRLEGELYAIDGSTYAIPLGPEDPATGLYPYKEADILGWVLRVAWSRWLFTVQAEAGRASGDDDPMDTNFSGHSLHPDYNVGLILYEELLAQRTREAWADNEGLWSKGGVYNSYYFMLTAKAEPLPGLEIVLGVLTAWADRVCDAVYQGIGCPDPAAHPNLGVEIDLAVRYRFYDDHARAVIEGGWLRPDNDTFNLGPYGLSDTDMWTLQTRFAFSF
jgi:hypothetical protein